VAQAHKRAHDRNIHGDRTFAVRDGGKHRNAPFGGLAQTPFWGSAMSHSNTPYGPAGLSRTI
jgi:hypothetical protein